MVQLMQLGSLDSKENMLYIQSFTNFTDAQLVVKRITVFLFANIPFLPLALETSLLRSLLKTHDHR